MGRAVALLVFGLAMGCGGSETAIPGDGDGGGGGGGDGGGGDGGESQDGSLVSPLCPSTMPAVGTSCTKSGLLCEYDATWHPTCVVSCEAGKWTLDPSASSCVSPDAGASTCPVAQPGQNSACNDQTPGGCDYPQAHCECHGFCGGVALPDASSIPPAWDCAGAPQGSPGCPFPRPRFGEACEADANLYCSYTICCSGSSMQCQNGIWQGQIELGGCP
jgi:hypothetical protein